MIDFILMKFKLWSFAILPTAGFLIGHLLQLLLGTKHNPKFESLFIHLITVTLMMVLFFDIMFGSESVKDPRDRALVLAISYTFVLGVILGIISVLY